MDFEILDFEDNLIQEESLVNKIDVVNGDQQEDESILNSDLIDEDNQDFIDLSEEEKEELKKVQSNKNKEVVTEETSTETSNEEESSEESPFKIFANELKERNLIELDEDWDGDEEALFEAYAKTAERRSLELVKDSYKIEDPRVDGFLRYVKLGGDLDTYIQQEKSLSWVDVDIENEDNAKILVTNYLKQIKQLDDEEALELVDGYLDKGKLSTQASKIQAELQAVKASKEKELIEAQEHVVQEQRRLFVEQTNKIKTVIQTGKVGSTIIPKNKKAEIENFMFTPEDKKNEKGEVVTKVTGLKKVLNDYFNDPEKLVELAYKLYEGFSDSSIKTEAESKAKSRLADVLKSRATKSGSIIDRNSIELIN